MDTPAIPENPIPRIGILTGDLSWEDSYPDILFRTSMHVAKNHNCNVTMIVGRSRPEQSQEHPDRAIFSLLANDHFQGLIIAPALLTSMDQEHRLALLTSLPKIPTVLLTIAQSDVPMVVVDNNPGMLKIMDHLIKHHHKKRIANLSGPLIHFEAQLRLNTWRNALIEAQLDHDDCLTVECAWQGDDINEALESLLEKSGGFDALVCSNDLPAIKAISFLRAKGYRVPEDIAVTGFDGISSTLVSDPPLTTVNQPLWEQLNRAFELVLAPTPPLRQDQNPQWVASTLQVRGSCGCSEKDWTKVLITDFGNPNDLPLKCIQGDSLALQEWIRTANPRPIMLQALHSTLEIQIAENVDRTPKLYQAISYLDRAIHFRINQRFIYTQHCTEELNNLNRALTSWLKINDLPDLLAQILPRLGIRTYALSLVSHNSSYPSRHISSQNSGQLLPSPPQEFHLLCSHPSFGGNIDYAAKSLFPPVWLGEQQNYNLIILPLVSGNAWYGIIALEAFDDSGLIARGVQESISAFLDREYHYQELLKTAIDERSQSHIETERRQLLSTLVSGVAHEMNTPIGTSITSLSFLVRRLAELHIAFDQNALTIENMNRYFLEQKEGLEIIERNLNRANELVQVFKRVSVNDIQEKASNFDLPRCITLELHKFENPLIERKVLVVLDGPPQYQVHTILPQLQEVISAFINNACVHAWPIDQGGKLVISYGDDPQDPRFVLMRLEDDGVGIPEMLHSRIFEPFFSTRRHQGLIGLGLSIVKNIVTMSLKGTIRLLASSKLGSSFEIRFLRQLPVPKSTYRS